MAPDRPERYGGRTFLARDVRLFGERAFGDG